MKEYLEYTISCSEAKKNATQFLKDQARIIAKYGKAPKLSGEKYQTALKDVVKTFRSLSRGKGSQ